ncbi:exosortase A [Kordiimonas aestuarii]|uniref:exosortase A n=1 Tax=Kordiimonas aestuarii TaxID=1005925 RepID=UPI0021CEC16E|nr:exosortase A [Kordiimonas aestuarii]
MKLGDVRLLPNMVFLACVGLVCFAWQDTLEHIFYIVWNRDVYSHGVTVPVVTLWLVWRCITEAAIPPPQAYGRAASLVLLAVLLWMLGAALEARVLEHVALVGILQALVIMVYGPAVYRQILFPMLFLFLVIPVGGGLVHPLQRVTAESVIWLLDVVGVPHEAEGVLIRLRGGLYEVAEACAGLKFFFASVVTGVLLCHLAFKSWDRRAVMLTAALIVPVVANIIRVFTILLIAEATDQDFAKSIDHIVYGWVFLSIVLFILIIGAYRFSDRAEQVVVATAPVNWSVWQPRVFFLVAFLPLGASLWMSGTESALICNIAPVAQPLCDDCGYRPLPDLINQQPYGLQKVDASETFLYRHGGQRIAVYVAMVAPDRKNHRLIQTAHTTLRDDWLELGGAPTRDITHEDVNYREAVLRRERERLLVWRAFYVGGEFRGSVASAKAAFGKARLLGRSANGAELIIATDMSEDIDAARAQLQKFLSTFPADSFLWKQLRNAEGRAICAE